MAGKMANVLWFEGSFVETLKDGNPGGFISPSHVIWNGPRSLSSDPDPHAAHVLERDGPIVG